MNLLKVATIVNWMVIGLLLLLVGAETLFPAKGGDAAGRGMGQAIYYLAVIVLAVLLVLNLLPYAWSKYLCFGLIVAPILYFSLAPSLRNLKRHFVNRLEAKPWFEDAERERMAHAIFDGNPQKLQKLLREPLPRWKDKGYTFPLLNMAVRQASSSGKQQSDRLECARLLLRAGASMTSHDPELEAVHFYPASMGYPEVLHLLLEHGANPNARGTDYSTGRGNKVPILFSALDTWYGAQACVELLLRYGADPNAQKPRDGDTLQPSILLYAASQQRWDICRLLIEKGADSRYKSPDGQSLGRYFENAAPFTEDQYTKQADFDFVKKTVRADAAKEQ